jgi:hypothetical protein
MIKSSDTCLCRGCGGKSIPNCYRSRQLAASASASASATKLNKEGHIQIVEPVLSSRHVHRVVKVEKNQLESKIRKLESELIESNNQKTALIVGFGIFALIISLSIYLKK